MAGITQPLHPHLFLCSAIRRCADKGVRTGVVDNDAVSARRALPRDRETNRNREEDTVRSEDKGQRFDEYVRDPDQARPLDVCIARLAERKRQWK